MRGLVIDRSSSLSEGLALDHEVQSCLADCALEMGMGLPLRMLQEEDFYFVTSRCFQGRPLLRPGAEVNEVVGDMP